VLTILCILAVYKQNIYTMTNKEKIQDYIGITLTFVLLYALLTLASILA